MIGSAAAWVSELTALWEPPPHLGGAAWADACRELGPDESAQPGPWRSLGWQRYLLDLFADPAVDWVVVLKAAQIGVSELVRCAIGRWAMLDPGDVLWVMSDEKSADKAMVKLRKMFRNSPKLRHLLPGDGGKKGKDKDTLKELVLTNGMRIVIGWAGSPASLASDSFPRVVLDETGLYPAKVGREGSPIGLAEERTKTFGRRMKVIMLSKPAHADDLICTAHDECLDQRERAVPCPACGELSSLDWERVRWTNTDGEVVRPATAPTDPISRLLLAGHVEQAGSAWVECPSCAGPIVDVMCADADQRAAWLRVDENNGAQSRRRAVHISELYHWSKGISDLVVRYLRACKPGDVQNFHTGSLGRPYEQERGSLTPELFQRKAVHEPGLVPIWATAIIASVDTQKDYLRFMVRSWGPGYKSRLVEFGRVDDVLVDGVLHPDWAELVRRTLGARWPVEGTDRQAGPVRLVIDAGGGDAGGALEGSRSQAVYRFAETTPRVTALKGSGEKRGANEGMPITWTKVRFGRDKERTVEVVQPHAGFWRDQTAALCRGEAWEETTQAAAADYTSEMTGQRQVYEQTAGGQGRWVWRKKRGRADHLWDCAYMSTVGAELEGAADLVPLQQVAAADTQARRDEDDEDDEDNDWLGPYVRSDRW